MKTAKYHVVSVEFQCPFCDAYVCEPNSGSTYWELIEFHAGQVSKCENGYEFRLPKVRTT